MEANALFVPMYLSALVVGMGNATPKVKKMAPNLSRLTQSASFQNLGSFLPPSVTDTPQVTLGPGVYLHWVLPSFYRTGQLPKDQEGQLIPGEDEFNYPYAPNRWLVVRSTESAAPELTAWIIESDAILPTKDKAPYNWPKDVNHKSADGSLPFSAQKIGKVTSLTAPSKWEEQAAGQPLFFHLMPPAMPEFGASFTHSQNVLGMVDAMTAAEEGKRFSYRVFGWIAKPQGDPLAPCQSKEELGVLLQQANWSLSEAAWEALTDANLPKTTYCHAMTHTLVYSKQPLSGMPLRENVEVAIGTHVGDTMATLLRPTQDAMATTFADRLLAAYQYDLLRKNANPEHSASALREQPLKEIQARGFNQSPGGSLWLVQKPHTEANADLEKRNTDRYLPFSDKVSKLLQTLNALQAELDATENELVSHQAHLNALAYKMTYSFNDTFAPHPSIKDSLGQDGALQKAMKITAGKVGQLKDRVDALRVRIGLVPATSQTALAALRKALKEDDRLQEYSVDVVSMPSFHSPTEPYLAFNGLNPAPIYANQISGAKDIMRCRINAELATEVIVPWDSTPYHVAANSLEVSNKMLGNAAPQLPAGLSPNPEALLALFRESLLLDPLFAQAIALKVAYFSADYDVTASAIRYPKLITEAFSRAQAQASFMHAYELRAMLPEGISLQGWSQPWIPLYLEWELEWQGKRIPEKPAAFWTDWSFATAGTAIDFQWVGTAKGKGRRFKGRTFLSADQMFKTRDLNAKFGEGVSIFENYAPLLQDLGGWSQQLLQRVAGLQFPYIVPKQDLFSKEKIEDLFDGINGLIGDQANWIPLLENEGAPISNQDACFHLIRAGMIKFTLLRIVDSFGQVIPLIDPTAKVEIKPPKYRHAASVVPVEGDPTSFILPPRIVQPARLRWEWLSARHPNRVTDSDPGTGPVCGWVIYNRIDDSFSLFNADGTEAGTLQLTAQDMAFLPALGQTKVNCTDRALQGFADGLLAGEAADRATRGIQLKNALLNLQIKLKAKTVGQMNRIKLPIGEPVALVKARCTLDLKHVPALPQSWLSDPLAATSESPLLQIPFRACIGNHLYQQDGLLGCFWGEDFSALHMPFGYPHSSDGYLKAAATLELRIGSPQTLYCLLDPRASVEVATGILPSARFELPIHALQETMNTLHLRFLAAPLLIRQGSFPPQPHRALSLGMDFKAVLDLSWNWLTLPEGQLVTTKIDPSPGDSLGFQGVEAVDGYIQLQPNPESTQ